MGRGTRLKTAAALNALLMILECVAMAYNLHDSGLATLRFYTVDSNLLSLIASALFVVFAVRSLKRGTAVPGWVRMLRFVATSCLAVTLIVVVTVLYPMLGDLHYLLFVRGLLYNHTLCPVLAAVTQIFFETEPPLEKKNALLVPAVTFLYGLVAVSLNLARVLYGPYPFLHVYEIPVWESVFWYVLILSGSWAIARGIAFLNRFAGRKQQKRIEGKNNE